MGNRPKGESELGAGGCIEMSRKTRLEWSATCFSVAVEVLLILSDRSLKGHLRGVGVVVWVKARGGCEWSGCGCGWYERSGRGGVGRRAERRAGFSDSRVRGFAAGHGVRGVGGREGSGIVRLGVRR